MICLLDFRSNIFLTVFISFILDKYYSLFFKQVAVQLLSLTEEGNMDMLDEGAFCDMNGTLLFVGETFSRICRRGFVGNYYNFKHCN